MKTNTIISCFGLLSIFIFFSLIGQFLFSTFTKQEPVSIYRVFPVTSLPVAARLIRGNEAASRDAQVPEQMNVTLKSGQEFRGEIIGEEPGWIILRIDGSEIGFRRSEIESIQAPETG